MLKKLFSANKKKWQHQDQHIRLEAVKVLNPSIDEELNALLLVASEDTIQDIRHTAITALPTKQQLQILTQIASQDSAFIAQQLLSHFDAHNQDIAQLTPAHKTSLLIHSKTYSPLIQQLQSSLSNDQKAIVIKQSLNLELQKALLNTASTSELTAHAKHFMQSNKRLYKHIKQQLDAIKQSDKQQSILIDATDKLLSDIESLSRSQWQPLYPAQCQHIQDNWSKLDDSAHKQKLQEKFTQALITCQTLIAQQTQEEQKQQQQAQTIAQLNRSLNEKHALILEHCADTIDLDKTALEVAQYLEEYAALSATSDSYKNHEANAKILQQLKASLLTARNQQEKISKLSNANNIKKNNYTTLENNKKEITQIITRIAWPHKTINTPVFLLALQKQAKIIDAHIENLDKDIEKNTRNCQSLSKDISEALDSGQSKQALALHKKLNSTLENLPYKHAKKFEPSNKKIEAQLKQLQDWKKFATNPKHEKLCEEMEVLIHADIPANTRLKAIKTLQQNWKTLDGKASNSLWRRFKQAGNQAFEKCQKTFDLKKDVLTHNLEQRKVICKNMEVFIAETPWDNTDWTAVQAQYDNFHKQWRSFFPVDKNKASATNDVFSSLCDTVKEKLQTEWDYNHQQQTKLIDQAKALLDTDNEEAIEKSKKLQERWKNIGITNRYKNRDNWKKFNAAIDALYTKKKDLRKESITTQKQASKQADNIIKSIHALCKIDDAQLGKSKEQFETLTQAYENLDELPFAIAKKVQHQFDKACDTYRQHLNGLSARQKLLDIKQLNAVCELIDELERSKSTNSENITVEIEKLPNEFKKRVSPRLESTLNNSATCDEEIKLLCIQLEILCGVESPSHAQQTRMQYQIEQLKNKGLNKNTADTRTQITAKQIDILCTGPVSAELRQEIGERTKNALAHSTKKR